MTQPNKAKAKGLVPAAASKASLKAGVVPINPRITKGSVFGVELVPVVPAPVAMLAAPFVVPVPAAVFPAPAVAMLAAPCVDPVPAAVPPAVAMVAAPVPAPVPEGLFPGLAKKLETAVLKMPVHVVSAKHSASSIPQSAGSRQSTKAWHAACAAVGRDEIPAASLAISESVEWSTVVEVEPEHPDIPVTVSGP